MITKTIFLGVGLLLSWGICLSAMDLNINFHEKYNESMAKRLVDKRKYVEAIAFLDKVLPGVEDEKSRQLLFAQKLVALGCQKGRCQEALDQVSALKDPALRGYCAYMIHSRQNQYDVIAEKYLDEDISLWPVELQTTGYLIRGKVYQDRLDHKKKAVADYAKVLEFKELDGFKRVHLYVEMARMTKGDDPEAAKRYFKEAHDYFQARMTRHLKTRLYANLIWEWAQLLITLKEDGKLLDVLNRFNGDNPDRIKKVLAAKADAYGRLGDAANQKLYQSYLDNFIKNSTKEEKPQ